MGSKERGEAGRWGGPRADSCFEIEISEIGTKSLAFIQSIVGNYWGIQSREVISLELYLFGF